MPAMFFKERKIILRKYNALGFGHDTMAFKIVYVESQFVVSFKN